MEVHNKSAMDPRIGPINYPISRSKFIKHTLFDDQKFEVKTNFTTGNVVRAFARLCKKTGSEANEPDCFINLTAFKGGYTLLALNLTPDRTPEDAHINLLRQGKVIGLSYLILGYIYIYIYIYVPCKPTFFLY